MTLKIVHPLNRLPTFRPAKFNEVKSIAELANEGYTKTYLRNHLVANQGKQTVCQCKRGNASLWDNNCGKCRTRNRQEEKKLNELRDYLNRDYNPTKKKSAP